MEENKEQADREKSAIDPALIAGSIIAAGFIIAGAIVYAGTTHLNSPKGSMGAAVKSVVPSEGNFSNEVLAASGIMRGNPEAQVTIVEFSDFQCPFCHRFFQMTFPAIFDTYVKTGKVKFVYRHFAFLGPESVFASEAAECANEQNKFWEYHDYLFTHQGSENSGAFSKENLRNFAKNIGLKQDQFDSCFNSEKYLDKVKKDRADGDRFGVTGTPTIFINGRKLVGAVPFSQQEAEAARQPYGVETVIEEALNNKK